MSFTVVLFEFAKCNQYSPWFICSNSTSLLRPGWNLQILI